MPSDGKPTDRAAERRRQVSRRHILRASAMGGAAALAGCSNNGDGGDGTAGDGGDGTSDGTSSGDFVPADNAMTEGITVNPTNYQFNHLNLTQPFSHDMQVDWFQRYNIAKEKITPYALEVTSFGDKKAELKVRDGLTWHNGDPGDPVNADDLYAKLVTDTLTYGTLGKLWTDINRSGDKSVELTLDGTVSRELFNDGLNYYQLETPWRKYKSYVERWEDATTGTAESSIRGDLRSDRFEEPHGNGPFKVTDISSSRLRMKKYEHHPDADNINWDYWDLEKVSSDTASVLVGMEVDAFRNYNPPQSVFKNVPDAMESAALPALWGQSLPFNHNDEDFGKVRVRQAISEFVDRKACANNYGRWGQPVEAPSGLVGNINGQNEKSDRWRNKVSKDMADTLHRYRNPDRGRRLLREEGYQKDNGTWYKPNGDKFAFTIKVPTYNDWHPLYQTIVDNLKSEGIQAEMQTIEASAYWSDHYLANNYKVAATGWTLQRSSPYYVWDQYYNVDIEFLGIDPTSVKAPPVGKPDGDLQEFDVTKLHSELLTARGDRYAELTDKLAWITNQAMPMLQIHEINDATWYRTDNWEIPPTDDPAYQAKFPLWWLPRRGMLQAKPK
ncbi:ABC transporter substrate-binding protein [Halosimplex aquaticum]|uniref:ABC transporter substrate-binding protein n=1 Tax=Halosimplex aquaticum TaxID=3026162 RepID=A0ABD5Y3W3_9EURY|nr:ABC transporter substrate-binding protein [Halosimplex aquaticum]